MSWAKPPWHYLPRHSCARATASEGHRTAESRWEIDLVVKQIKLTLSVVWIKADGSAAAHKQLASGSQHPEVVQHPKKRHKSLSVYLPLFTISTRTTYVHYLEKPVLQSPSSSLSHAIVLHSHSSWPSLQAAIMTVRKRTWNLSAFWLQGSNKRVGNELS